MRHTDTLLPLKYVSPGEDKTPCVFAAFLSFSFTNLIPASSSSTFLVSRADNILSHVLQFFVSVTDIKISNHYGVFTAICNYF